MNILMLNHNRIWESTFNRAFYFGRSLAEFGHTVTVVTNAKKRLLLFNEFEHQGVTIIETPDLLWGKLRTGWDLVNALRRMHYLKEKHFDIIHAFDCRPVVIFPALYLKSKLEIPLVIDWADWWGRGGAIKLRDSLIFNKLFEPIETFFEEYFRKYAEYTTVISSLLKKRAISLGVDEQKIKLVFHGCDTQEIVPLNKIEARRELNLQQYKFIVVFSGFVLYDFNMALESFFLALKKCPDTLLILTGSYEMLREGNGGRFRNSKNILFLGFLSKDKYNQVLGASDLCLLPLSDNLANRARYPGRIGDYMSAGRPIISNDVGDIGRIIKDNDIGILTKPDAKSFSEGIIDALNDPVNREKWGCNARAVAEEKLSFNILSREFENIYLDLVNRG